jgi:putative protease
VDYRDNITNSKAVDFYRRHGVTNIAPQDLQAETGMGCTLMTTKYCIKAQLGLCTRSHQAHSYVEPFILADNTGEYVLEFDCAQCEMTVRKKPTP